MKVMTKEAILQIETELPINMTCADGVGIEKGAILELSGSAALTCELMKGANATIAGIANSENVPFYMRTAQWKFLEKEKTIDKYIIARVYKNGSDFSVKYMKVNMTNMN